MQSNPKVSRLASTSPQRLVDILIAFTRSAGIVGRMEALSKVSKKRSYSNPSSSAMLIKRLFMIALGLNAVSHLELFIEGTKCLSTSLATLVSDIDHKDGLSTDCIEK